MTFAYPYFLLLLLLLPLAAWLKGKRGQPPAFVYSSVQLLRGVLDISRTSAGRFSAALRWLALALFIIALAQPRLTRFDTSKATASGVDIVVAFDISGSMAQADFVADCDRVTKLLAERLQAHGGSISAEHGIGLVKKPYLSSTRSEAEIALMRGIKAVLDPAGIMNPGKLFDP